MCKKLGFGIGFDLPWTNGAIGFNRNTGYITDRVKKYLKREDFSYFMFSFQPKSCAFLNPDIYINSYIDLKNSLPENTPLIFHQTTLNLGSLEKYDRSSIINFTNKLHDILNFEWVVEDVGIWSHNGIPMPYPVPPFLVEETIDVVGENVKFVKNKLKPKFHLEFPGFTDGFSVVVGKMDAYDWFRKVVEYADVDVTLDVGHLLSYRWLLGNTDEGLYEGLERLPLDKCREIHLSGSIIRNGKFLDTHHGILLDQQIVLLDKLVKLCPNLMGVTYEDPAVDGRGYLAEKAIPNVELLKELVSKWKD